MGARVCTCLYVPARPRARLWYGTMQRLQVLGSRESTNEHKTCQQPWEVGGVSTELLVRGRCLRSIEEVNVVAREPDHLPERPFGTNPLLVMTARIIVFLSPSRERENMNEDARIVLRV